MKDGSVASDGRSTCPDCGHVSKNERGHKLHWTKKHGKYSKVESKKKPTEALEVSNVNSSVMTFEGPGEICGQKFILTVDLSIAATGIRPA